DVASARLIGPAAVSATAVASVVMVTRNLRKVASQELQLTPSQSKRHSIILPNILSATPAKLNAPRLRLGIIVRRGRGVLAETEQMNSQTGIRQLRRWAIAGSLGEPKTLHRALGTLGFVQADPIRSPARAQDLILRHRVADYRAGDLERAFAR